MVFSSLKSKIEVIDLFSHSPSLNINSKSSISTTLGLILSCLIYLISILIIAYNFIEVYTHNEPIVVSQEENRDLNNYESIPNQKLNFGFHFYQLQKTNNSASLISYKHKDLETLNIHINDSDFSSVIQITEMNFIPYFSANEHTIGELNYNCSNLFDSSANNNKSTLVKDNGICINYFNKTGDSEIGGSILEAGKYKEFVSSLRIPICDLYDINEGNDWEDYLKNNILDNNTSYYTSQYRKNCLLNPPIDKFKNILIGVSFSSDLIDIYSEKGYYSYVKSSYDMFDFREYGLSVYIYITKTILQTDFSFFYNFGKSTEVVFYDQKVEFKQVKKGIVGEDILIDQEYIINEKVVYVYRSYNKVDNILANCFSIINIFFYAFFIIDYLVNKNVCEYELINKLYYYNNLGDNENKIKKSIFINKNNLSKDNYKINVANINDNDNNTNVDVDYLDKSSSSSKENFNHIFYDVED